MLSDFVRLCRKYRRNQRFITPLFGTLGKFYETASFFSRDELKELNLQVMQIINEECLKTKYATKLMATPNLLCTLASTLIDQYQREGLGSEQSLRALDASGVVPMMSHLLNHEFPKVAKTTSDSLFRFLSLDGGRILSQERCDGLTAYLLSVDWIMIDINNLDELKTKFRGLLGLEEGEAINKDEI